MDDPVSLLRRQAITLRRQGRRAEAINAYRRLLAGRPELTDDWYDLGYLLKNEGRFDEALEAYAEALARGVHAPEEVHLNRAVIYADHLRQDEPAENELRSALARKPGYLPALLNLGNLQEERGQRQDAVACYERIIESSSAGKNDPERALRYEALARLAQLRPPAGREDPLLERLRSAAGTTGGLDPTTRANLWFSLGRAYDSLGAFDEAFAAFKQANQHAQRAGPAYDAARTERLTGALIDAFPALSAVPSAARETAPGPEPLFICGMFRSGSTLLEQALAGHPRVTAGGELDFLPRLAANALAPFPASMESLGRERAAAIAADYLAHLRRLFPQAAQPGALVIDKRPDNYLLIGLIMRLYPTARVIHTVRDPLDNCLSVFFQHLDQRLMPYSTDLAAIGHQYGEYRRLMDHWRRTYPGSILDFDYDAFVHDPKPALKAALDFLGLGWDDRCLDFHRRGGTVKTASYWQVRRPLYRDASGRWRNYSAHLGPLREALARAGVGGLNNA